jgi:peptidoglycan hydrolase-like protein with peptidoglycan-binding domain
VESFCCIDIQSHTRAISVKRPIDRDSSSPFSAAALKPFAERNTYTYISMAILFKIKYNYLMKFYQRATTFFFILSCVAILFPAGVFASELIGHWKFDETSGGAVDSTGNHATLTNNNGVTYSTGQYGNAAYFNGTNQYFSGIGPNLASQSFTFSAWLWRDSDAVNERIYFSLGDTNSGQNHNLHLRVGDDGFMRFGFLSNDLDAPSGTFAEGQWNHVVLTYDAGTNVRKIYLNGGAAKASDTSGSDFLGDTLLNIGRWSNGAQYWDGRIDDLKIYNRALTQNEITDIAEGGVGPGLLGIDEFSPADNATGVSLTANLTATFSTTTVATSTGSVSIYKTSDDSLVESIAVSSSQITKSGAAITINPSVTFQNSTEYYVWIPSTAFKDADDVFYEGTTASTTWSFTTLADGTAPTISNIATSSITNTGATLTWDTDEAASTKVVYSADTNYASTTAEADTSARVTSHSQALSSLLVCTIYNYRVVSRDVVGNAATSTSSTFLTTGCSGGATPSTATSTVVTVSSAATTTVTDGNNTFTVETPEDFTATSSSIVIQIKGLSSSTVLGSIGKPSSSLNSGASVVFDVKALIDNITELDSFDVPVSISYTYSDGDISSLDENTLSMYHYANSAWSELDDCSISTSTNTITCTAPHFSIFGIFGSPLSSSEESSSGSSSGTHFGCKDPNASNYEYFSKHKQELCKYEVVTASVCLPHITTYIHYGAENNTDDVRKLETFLNDKQGEFLVVDGVYGVEDLAAVKRFQKKYASEVLGVWGLSEPTGYVYRTTLMKINSFYCDQSLTCPAFTEYNSRTENSTSTEVAKTKTLLSELGFYSGVINNTFDTSLNTSLKSFQETFSETMLKPWGLVYGTGYKYKTTNKFLNMLVGCQTSAVELDGRGTFNY